VLGKRVEALSAFVPTPIALNLSNQALHNRLAAFSQASAPQPHVARLPAAVLFADISGFTILAEAFAHQSSEGSEELTALLNRYFTRMISLLEAYQGQVVKFSGDAITAFFGVNPLNSTQAKHEARHPLQESSPSNLEAYQLPSLFEATLHAAHAALAMQAAMQDFQTQTTSIGQTKLALKIGLGAGNILALQVGGCLDRWEYAIAGDAVAQAAAAEQHAEPGMVILAPQATSILGFKTPTPSFPELLKDEAFGPGRLGILLGLEKLAEGPAGRETVPPPPPREAFAELEGLDLSFSPPLCQPLPGPRPNFAPSPTSVQHLPLTLGPLPKPLHPNLPPFDWQSLSTETLKQAEKILRSYVPAVVTTRLAAGQSGWLAELRRMTIMFVGVGGFVYEDERALEPLQAFVAASQEIIAQYEGTFSKVAVDDKGTVMLVLFGAPPLSHEDDPQRALGCAHEIQAMAPRGQTDRQRQAKMPVLQVAIGITTDTVFTGPVGSPTRREYTVMGDGVNLASRLMQAAGAGQTLCDHPTYLAAAEHWNLEPLLPLNLKGKAQPVQAYRFTGQRANGTPTRARPLVGRESELATLHAYLTEVKAGLGVVVSLIGEGGIGKTHLLHEFLAQVRQQKGIMPPLQGTARSIGQQTPYLVWREVLTSYFGLEPSQDEPQRMQIIRQQVQAFDPDIEERLPLLNDILEVRFPETQLTRSLDPRQRRDNLAFLVIELLLAWTKISPQTTSNTEFTLEDELVSTQTLLVVLDDLHWADSLSWELALDMARMVLFRPVLLILSCRPIDQDDGSHLLAPLRALNLLDQHRNLPLVGLESEAIAQLTATYLGGKPVTEELALWLTERSQGNPYFVEETIRMLHEQEALGLNANGHWALRDKQRLTAVPPTLKGVIQARLDQLKVNLQLTCKVASVVGRVFPAKAVAGIYPVAREVTNLAEHLKILASKDITPLESYDPDPRYQFKSSLTQEVAYTSLLLVQRQALHQAVAEWYEKEYADNLEPYVPLLADHYSHTEQWQRRLEFAERAANLALKSYATTEALLYLTQSIDLLRDHPELLVPEKSQNHLFQLLIMRAEVHEQRSNYSQEEKDLTALTAIATEMADKQAMTTVKVHWARFYQITNAYKQAEDLALASLKEARQLGYRQLMGDCLNILAQNAVLQGNYHRVQWWGFHGLENCQSTGDRAGEAQSLNLLGMAGVELGDYDQAATYYQQALTIHRTIENRWGEAACLAQLGNLTQRLGSPREALNFYNEALKLSHRIGDRNGEAGNLLNISKAYQSLGDLSAAQLQHQAALTIWRAIGNQRGEAELLVSMSSSAVILGDFEAAQTYATDGLRLAQKLGNRQLEVHALDILGKASRGLAKTAHLWRRLYPALSAAWEKNPPPPENPNLNPASLCDVAYTEHRAAYELAHELGMRRAEAYACHHLGEWFWEYGHFDNEEILFYVNQTIHKRIATKRAAYHWAAAAALREEMGEVEFARASRTRQAHALALLGDLAQARALAESVWAFWGQKPPIGEDSDELREAYFAFYEIWLLLGEKVHSTTALAWAYQAVQDRAIRLSNSNLRHIFLSRVAINCAIITAWREIVGD